MKQATFKLATLSAAIALSLSIAGCKEKKLEAVPADQVRDNFSSFESS